MAAPGERREYRIIVRAQSRGVEVERRELWIRIDKRAPASPRIQPEAGSYTEPLSISFGLEAKGDRLYYTLQGDLSRSPTLWNGNPLPVGRIGEKRDFVVQAYVEDEAGNRSVIASSRYSVDARDPVLEVVSPVRGSFANPQALAVVFRGVQWVRYTVDGSDPAVSGVPYTGVVTIEKRGLTTVRVAAQPRGAGRPVMRRDVTYTYTPETGTGLLLDLANGTYPRSIAPRVLSVPEGTLYYALWEKTPSDSDYIAVSTIPLPADDIVARPIVLRLRNLTSGGAWGAEYRYFFFVGQPGTSRA